MKTETQKTIMLTLTEYQARQIMALMQNPLVVSQSPYDEEDDVAELRKELFTAIKEATSL